MNKQFLAIALATTMLGGFAGLAEAATAASAAEYTQFLPMNKAVSASVRECRGGEGSNVKFITWGADLITTYANGNAKETKAGSIMASEGLHITLTREDNFVKQVEGYLRCDTPYLRATAGQANMAAAVTEGNPNTKLIQIFQHSWSNGGDAFVVKGSIKRPEDLKGKTIVLQAYGPHVDYLFSILADAGLSPKDVTLKFTKDLVGLDGNTPGAAFAENNDVDAAMVIIPDALALTSGGNVGNGSEGSVRGATVLLTTKTLNRQISDGYYVRADYLKAHPTEVQSFAHALLTAEDKLVGLMRDKTHQSAEYKETVVAGATLILDAPTLVADMEGMWHDAETTGFNGNVKFFTDANFPRNYTKLNEEIQKAYVIQGLLPAPVTLGFANWNYGLLKAGITGATAEVSKIDTGKLQNIVTAKAANNTLDDTALYTFDINFKPNSDQFPVELYADKFQYVIEKASKYGGAAITVEGNTDVLKYLKTKQQGAGEATLNQLRQAGKTDSIKRAIAVRDAIIDYAKQRGVTLNPDQFVIVGYGLSKPKTGMCGADPCAPQTKADWLSNMRVSFQILNLESEASEFELLK